MNIIAIDYSMATQSLDIFLSGCKSPHCEGCHNPESWDFNKGKPWTEWIHQIFSNVELFDGMVKRIFVLGGEPLDQDEDELKDMIAVLAGFTTKELWLFTRYSLDEVPDYIKRDCDYIKTGPYIEQLRDNNYISCGVRLATLNQRVNKRGVDYLT